MKDLADVVAKIGKALADAGFTDRAVLLAQWEADLRSGDIDRQRAARDELRGVVHGLGGLLDLSYGSPEETRRIDELIDVMWQEVRVEP